MSVSVLIKNSCTNIGEGPHWDDVNQCLLYVDIYAGDVHRWNSVTGEDQKLHIGEPAVPFIIPSSAGGYMVSVGRTLGHLDWDTNTYTQIAEVDPGTTNLLNDAKCDSKGRLWTGTFCLETLDEFRELGRGYLYSIDSQRNLTKHLDKINLSNGIAWSLDDQIMYFVDSLPGKIFAYDFDLEKGTIDKTSERIVLNYGNDMKTNEHGAPDGITIDTEGKLWVACYGKNKVIRLDPETGKIIQEVKFPCSRITSCCFGGRNWDELYVTSSRLHITDEELKTAEAVSGSVFKVTGLGVRGRPDNMYQA